VGGAQARRGARAPRRLPCEARGSRPPPCPWDPSCAPRAHLGVAHLLAVRVGVGRGRLAELVAPRPAAVAPCEVEVGRAARKVAGFLGAVPHRDEVARRGHGAVDGDLAVDLDAAVGDHAVSEVLARDRRLRHLALAAAHAGVAPAPLEAVEGVAVAVGQAQAVAGQLLPEGVAVSAWRGVGGFEGLGAGEGGGMRVRARCCCCRCLGPGHG
jgi:hypothetical protein